MAFEDLLDHRCAIYHMRKDSKDMGYGITSSDFSYPDNPDHTNVPCHFNVNDGGNITQTENVNEYIVVGKLQLPVGTDIRINDKVVNLDTGVSYTAEIPKNIRNHHIIVNIQKKGTVKGVL